MPKNYAYRFVAKSLVVSLLSSTMIHAFSDDILEKQLSAQYQSFSKLRTVTLNSAISPTVQFVQHLMQTPDDYLARKLALLIGKGAGVGGVGQREATEQERMILRIRQKIRPRRVFPRRSFKPAGKWEKKDPELAWSLNRMTL